MASNMEKNGFSRESESDNSIKEIIPAENNNSENEDDTKDENGNNSTEAADVNSENDNSVEENDDNPGEPLSIDEQVLWEVDGVKITATGVNEDSFWGAQINLLVENNSDKDIGIGADAIIVNDYMITDFTSISVTAGNKSNDKVTLFSSELKAAGIDTIGKVEMYLYTYDSNTYETLQSSGCITINMSAADTIDTETNIEGATLFDEGGIKIVGQYVDENSFWGSSILLYIENNSNQNVIISNEELAINGFMVTSFLYQEVYAGKKAIADIALLRSDLEANNITSIDNVETAFTIVDENYNEIANSGKVNFSAQ